MTALILARHGETDWNIEHRWQGWADQPLNETGRAQARDLADRLGGRRIDAIYASDLLRARETAEIVGARLELPVQLERGLREVNVGEWSGLTLAEIEARFPEGFRRWQEGGVGWIDGESYEEMGRRVIQTVVRISADRPDGTILVVTHGGSIRACRGESEGLGYTDPVVSEISSTQNCGVVELRVAAGRLAGDER